MVELLDSSEKAKKDLLQEVAAFRKQSLVALILAVLFLLITVYLYYELKQSKTALKTSNTTLEMTNARLKASEKRLEEQNNEILALNKALDPSGSNISKKTLPLRLAFRSHIIVCPQGRRGKVP